MTGKENVDYFTGKVALLRGEAEAVKEQALVRQDFAAAAAWRDFGDGLDRALQALRRGLEDQPHTVFGFVDSEQVWKEWGL